MIDNITMIKKSLSEAEKNKIIKNSRLQEQSVNGLKHYDNRTTKNFDGGFYIKISTDNILKIAGSLHKYYSFLQNENLTNFGGFTMKQARETFLKLVENKGIEPDNMIITFYEIGLNLKTDIKPKEIIENIYSIGGLDNEKVFFINPNYKNKSHINTETHRDYRVYHKVYDKVFEMQDKKKPLPNDKNIIRVETVHRRVEKTIAIDFFTDENLNRLQKRFFSTWDGLNFDNDIEAPAGTHKSKTELAKAIYRKGKHIVLNKHTEQYKNKALPKKMYYNAKRFIDNWEIQKNSFQFKKTKICTHFEKTYMIEKQIHSDFITT
ncbi:hypothetical protein IUY40_18850 [Flavobacterium sp. ALJ2]|uniref:hypothetical protein n=1 Tax=Flavobacterium sp. ALJ2 TaxID=2786960 RepID=UPI00189FB0B4|nr:hypothetical protein [Flavobacterium sp. ALJ2]MBF7093594.1 hypothetical protein [Flavobacterium sp. ALJ2]